MEHKQIYQLKCGEWFTNEYQTPSHARRFEAFGPANKLGDVRVYYRDLSDHTIRETYYSPRWNVVVYPQSHIFQYNNINQYGIQ